MFEAVLKHFQRVSTGGGCSILTDLTEDDSDLTNNSKQEHSKS